MIDPADFEDDIQAAIKYAERCERGLPPDRWATVEGQYKVAHAIITLTALCLHYANAAAQAEYQRGLEAMRMAGE